MEKTNSKYSFDTLIKDSIKLLEEKKGEDIVCLNLETIHSYLGNFVIVTGSSRVHCRSLAAGVENLYKEQGYQLFQRPSIDSGWIILDYVDVVYHIFVEEEREYYKLEKLWSGAEVLYGTSSQ